jgi:hypothetical protein
MSNNDIRVSLNLIVTQTGIIKQVSVSDEDKVRFVITNAASNNTIVIRGRIVGQDDWDLLKTLNGDTKGLVSVKTYDEILIECTVYGSASGGVKVVAGSFNEAGGATTIGAPTGGTLEEVEIVNFTSSDNSINIIADPVNNIIDFKANGFSGTVSKYVKSILLTDWDLVLSEYRIVLPFSIHGKTNPIITCYEDNSGDLAKVEVASIVNSSTNDILIAVLSTPDTRFIGKIIIE